MKKLLLVLLVSFFIAQPAYALWVDYFVINKKDKTCSVWFPYSPYELPSGWEEYNYSVSYQKTCDELGYKLIDKRNFSK